VLSVAVFVFVLLGMLRWLLTLKVGLAMAPWLVLLLVSRSVILLFAIEFE